MLRNRNIDKQPVLTKAIQTLIQKTFTAGDVAVVSVQAESAKKIALLNFLSAALQVMPGQLCCDTATAISLLIDSSTDEKVKTAGFLALEVLYASRRLYEFGDHIETLMKHLLENPEMPEIVSTGDSSLKSNQRIIAYIQATSQVVLNFASNEIDQSDYMHRQILRYVTLACSVFCEYLVASSERVKRAGFSAMRLILAHGLKPRFFVIKGNGAPGQGKSETEKILDLLKFDALTLSEEVQSTRTGQSRFKNNLTPQERIVIHMCYLLTVRFQDEYDVVLRLVATFVQKVGVALEQKQLCDFLVVVSSL